MSMSLSQPKWRVLPPHLRPKALKPQSASLQGGADLKQDAGSKIDVGPGEDAGLDDFANTSSPPPITSDETGRIIVKLPDQQAYSHLSNATQARPAIIETSHPSHAPRQLTSTQLLPHIPEEGITFATLSANFTLPVPLDTLLSIAELDEQGLFYLIPTAPRYCYECEPPATRTSACEQGYHDGRSMGTGRYPEVSEPHGDNSSSEPKNTAQQHPPQRFRYTTSTYTDTHHCNAYNQGYHGGTGYGYTRSRNAPAATTYSPPYTTSQAYGSVSRPPSGYECPYGHPYYHSPPSVSGASYAATLAAGLINKEEVGVQKVEGKGKGRQVRFAFDR